MLIFQHLLSYYSLQTEALAPPPAGYHLPQHLQYWRSGKGCFFMLVRNLPDRGHLAKYKMPHRAHLLPEIFGVLAAHLVSAFPQPCTQAASVF